MSQVLQHPCNIASHFLSSCLCPLHPWGAQERAEMQHFCKPKSCCLKGAVGGGGRISGAHLKNSISGPDPTCHKPQGPWRQMEYPKPFSLPHFPSKDTSWALHPTVPGVGDPGTISYSGELAVPSICHTIPGRHPHPPVPDPCARNHVSPAQSHVVQETLG